MSLDGEKTYRINRKLNTSGRRPAAGNAMWDRDQERRDDRGGPRDLRENLDRGRREVDRGRDRGGRRSRSRSRSRSRERMGKRRADSPFSKAHDNWSKFKQAEKVIYLRNLLR